MLIDELMLRRHPPHGAEALVRGPARVCSSCLFGQALLKLRPSLVSISLNCKGLSAGSNKLR